MDDFLKNIWSENLYPAKAKLLKLAKESNPAVKAKDVENFLNGQISYQLLKESKNLSTKLGHIVAFKINEIWQIDLYDVSRFESSNKKFKYMSVYLHYHLFNSVFFIENLYFLSKNFKTYCLCCLFTVVYVKLKKLN